MPDEILSKINPLIADNSLLLELLSSGYKLSNEWKSGETTWTASVVKNSDNKAELQIIKQENN